jgi:uncharacterized protein
VSAVPLIARRGLTCGTQCQASPCTLGQMRAARRTIITDPRITLWAELAVVAHLTGWPSPRPAAAFAADLKAMDSPLLDCALSHAVDAAVTARVPGSLAVHVATVLRHLTTSTTRACDAEEPRYLAPPWQWILIRDALKHACGNSATGRHLPSGQWELEYRRQIPGASCGDQLRAVHRWHTRAQRDTRAIHVVVWGTRPHSAISVQAATTTTPSTRAPRPPPRTSYGTPWASTSRERPIQAIGSTR